MQSSDLGILGILLVVLQSFAHAQSSEDKFDVVPTLGIANLAYVLADDVLAREELEIKTGESVDLARMSSEFASSDEFRDLLSFAVEAPVTPDEYYRWIRGIRARIVECNKKIFQDIAGVLQDQKRIARHRQLCNQRFIALKQYQTVVFLNALPMTLEQFQQLHCDGGNEEFLLPETDISVARFRVVVRAIEELLGESLKAYSGEVSTAALTGIQLSLANLLDRSGVTEFKSRLDILTKPDIQQELTMTVRQVAAFEKIAKRQIDLEEKQNRVPGKNYGAEVSALADDFEKIQASVLNEVQQKRLQQLLFQQYASQMSLPKILHLLGRDQLSEEKMRDWLLGTNLLQTKTHYEVHSAQLRTGLVRFSVAYGKKKAMELCGRLALPRSPYEDTLSSGEAVDSSERAIRRESLEKLTNLPMAKGPINPRRNSRSR